MDVITGSTTYFELSGTTYVFDCFRLFSTVFDDPMSITDPADAVSTIASGGTEPHLASMGWAGDYTGAAADDLMLNAFGAQILAEDLNGDAAPDLLFTNPEPYTASSLHVFLGGT